MQIFDYQVGWRWSKTLLFWALCCAIGFLLPWLNHTNWSKAYWEGDALIPNESQLIKSGPYSLKYYRYQKPQRYEARFIDVNGQWAYTWSGDRFNPDIFASDIEGELHGQSQIYLWTYDANPGQKVWKVEAGAKEILGYTYAVEMYRSDTSLRIPLLMSGLALLAFLIFMVQIKHQPKVVSI